MTQALVFTRTKHRANRLAEESGAQRHRRRAHSWQPIAGAANAGAGRLQERALSRAGGHRHRRARHRRGGAEPRDQLRRPRVAGRLYPSRRPHRPRRATGEAFTFVSPDEEPDLRAIERAVGHEPAAGDATRFQLQGRRPRSSRYRSGIASPRSANGSARSASAPGSTRRAVLQAQEVRAGTRTVREWLVRKRRDPTVREAPAVRRQDASVAVGRVAGRRRRWFLNTSEPWSIQWRSFPEPPARTGRQPHQSGWRRNLFVPASARIRAMRALYADLQRKSGASSPMPGLSSAANEVATTPE